MGDFLLRSQLDCYEPDLPGEHKTFDLKTRATMGVRPHTHTRTRHEPHQGMRHTTAYNAMVAERQVILLYHRCA
jgi:hypothetical protein